MSHGVGGGGGGAFRTGRRSAARADVALTIAAATRVRTVLFIDQPLLRYAPRRALVFRPLATFDTPVARLAFRRGQINNNLRNSSKANPSSPAVFLGVFGDSKSKESKCCNSITEMGFKGPF